MSFKKHKKIKELEYCPNGHMNNLNLDGQLDDLGNKIQRKSGKCPKQECEYNK